MVDISSLSSRQALLNTLGPTWRLKTQTAVQPEAALAVEPSLGNIEHSGCTSVQALSAPSMTLPVLTETVKACRLCGLCQTRTQTVFSAGYEQAAWMLIGEAPGAEEDQQGQPFVGQAGKLLDNLLFSIGLSRHATTPSEAVYIANVLKCRPPNNRNPAPEEIAACQPYLTQQIEQVQPKILILLGRYAAQTILNTDSAIGALRGRVHHYSTQGGQTIPTIVTYHPAYLLRALGEKGKTWADLQLARRTYQQHVR
ncbi:uracil-DNA glycosylase [Parvibium lacunae]|uniref:Type-4 uracil-DNA glycosylase n=1 Tax=Parvibium lacunae TaxID=1888893 RepID=A0A368L836_9BURK|nr:uracil-DNA glycosylase [Parvibium lacunae]RCS59671.1 uracil-DNA glycosylase [Parvibium lacunae]